MRTVLLYDLTQCALILPAPSGIEYMQQCGGTSCFQRTLEGGLVPIAYNLLPQQYEQSLEAGLARLFPEGNPGGVEEAEADEIDRLLAASFTTAAIRVDRAQLHRSVEAWVYVVVDPATFKGSPFDGWDRFEAVLTWANSD